MPASWCSRSGDYVYLKRKKNDRDVEAVRLIRKVYHRYEGKYGYRQLQLFLWQDDGVWMNHKKVLRLMQKLGLQASIRRKRRFNMKDKVAERVAENLLKRDFTADKPNQKWVTDVTQYRVGERWLYLSAVKDLFNNEIIAYQLSERNDNELVLQTFTKAFAKQKDVTGLVVNSDQGFQYTSHAYHDMLPKGWRPNQHVSSGQLPGQRLYGELLLPSQNGRALPLSYPKFGRGTKPNRKIHTIL